MPSGSKVYTGAWILRQDYISACDWTPRPDGRVEYLVPRIGLGEDVTSFHPGQWDWSIENLPDIIYVLRKDASWDEFKHSAKPPQKIDPFTGKPMYERWPKSGQLPRPMLDYRILPDQIGTEEEPWYFEAVRRLDPRITYEDIIMRMMNVRSRLATEEKKFSNLYINNPLSRYLRPKFNLISWHGCESKARERVLSKLSATQIAANTTRGITPGLIDSTNPNGPRIPLPITNQNLGRRPGKRSKGRDVHNYPARNSHVSNDSTVSKLSTRKPSPRTFHVKSHGQSGERRTRAIPAALQKDHSPPLRVHRRRQDIQHFASTWPRSNLAPSGDKHLAQPARMPFSPPDSHPRRPLNSDLETGNHERGNEQQSESHYSPQYDFEDPLRQSNRANHLNQDSLPTFNRRSQISRQQNGPLQHIPLEFHPQGVVNKRTNACDPQLWSNFSNQQYLDGSNRTIMGAMRHSNPVNLETGQGLSNHGLQAARSPFISDDRTASIQSLDQINAPFIPADVRQSFSHIVTPRNQQEQRTVTINNPHSFPNNPLSFQPWQPMDVQGNTNVAPSSTFPPHTMIMASFLAPNSRHPAELARRPGLGGNMSSAMDARAFSKDLLKQHQTGGILWKDSQFSQTPTDSKQVHRAKRPIVEETQNECNRSPLSSNLSKKRRPSEVS